MTAVYILGLVVVAVISFFIGRAHGFSEMEPYLERASAALIEVTDLLAEATERERQRLHANTRNT